MASSPTHRRVQTRRGSASANDPYAKHAAINIDPNRSSSSTLTIVRVGQEPPSPVLGTRRNLHRRIGSGPNPTSSPDRLSFAISSFAISDSVERDGRSSPSSSPRLRPSSPTLRPSAFKDKPRLTPDQLLDLARQSQVPTANQVQAFTPLPDEIYLPFIDRPSEVAALISTPPTTKLLALLSQTFSKHFEVTDQIPKDPTKWTYTHLTTWLTQVPRTEAPDPVWAVILRKCILSHSELIWERLKGALGVPPELDIDLELLLQQTSETAEEEDEQHLLIKRRHPAATEEPANAYTEIEEDAGRKAHGYWEDWDAIMESPVFTRRQSISAFSVRSNALSMSDQDEPPSEAEDGELVINTAGIAGVTIEPLLVPDPLLHPATPLIDTNSTDGLQDITEDAEEEETEQHTDTAQQSSQATPPPPADPVDPSMISPCQIHGLRISTAPVPQDPTASPLLTAISPTLSQAVLSPLPGGAFTTSPLLATPRTDSGLARSASFSSVPLTSHSAHLQHLQQSHISSNRPPLRIVGSPGASVQRSSSFGSLGGLGRGRLGVRSGLYVRGGLGNGIGRGVSTGTAAGSSGHNPLFPSNFARLDRGPTLMVDRHSQFFGHRPKPRSRPPSRSSVYSFTSSNPLLDSSTDEHASDAKVDEPESEAKPPARRAAGVINSGAGVPLGIMPGGIIVGSRAFGRRRAGE